MEEYKSYGFENVEVTGGTKTPYIKLNKDEGIIEIKGRSIPENTVEFYWPFNRWLSEYSKTPASQTTINLALSYLNSASAVVITRLMQLLDNMIGLQSEVTVNWYYEKGDIEMMNMGKDYQEIMKCEVNLHEVEKLV